MSNIIVLRNIVWNESEFSGTSRVAGDPIPHKSFASAAAGVERPRPLLSAERAHHNGFGNNIAIIDGNLSEQADKLQKHMVESEKTYQAEGSARNHAERTCRLS
jgi:hypothetical protein